MRMQIIASGKDLTEKRVVGVSDVLINEFYLSKNLKKLKAYSYGIGIEVAWCSSLSDGNIVGSDNETMACAETKP